MLERVQWGLMVAEIPQRMPPWNAETEVPQQKTSAQVLLILVLAASLILLILVLVKLRFSGT